VFELKQSFSSEPIATCPECENGARRLFHSVPIVFKGSGWYVNDYGKRSTAMTSDSDSKEKSEKKSKSDSTNKSESTSDSKSETKSTSKTESAASTKSE
jgi:predicted nucleic acid-binding Zn ribbon protein